MWYSYIQWTIAQPIDEYAKGHFESCRIQSALIFGKSCQVKKLWTNCLANHNLLYQSLYLQNKVQHCQKCQKCTKYLFLNFAELYKKTTQVKWLKQFCLFVAHPCLVMFCIHGKLTNYFGDFIYVYLIEYVFNMQNYRNNELNKYIYFSHKSLISSDSHKMNPLL